MRKLNYHKIFNFTLFQPSGFSTTYKAIIISFFGEQKFIISNPYLAPVFFFVLKMFSAFCLLHIFNAP